MATNINCIEIKNKSLYWKKEILFWDNELLLWKTVSKYWNSISKYLNNISSKRNTILWYQTTDVNNIRNNKINYIHHVTQLAPYIWKIKSNIDRRMQVSTKNM